MVQELTTQPTIFGRLGKGLSQGLSETVPKEIEHQRLRSGLQNLSQQMGNLSPQQFAVEAMGTYGMTPQMIQSLTDIARFQGERNSALNQGNEEYGDNVNQPNSPATQQRKFPSSPRRGENLLKEVEDLALRNKGLTTYGPTQTALGDIRPPTQKELFDKRKEILRISPWKSVPTATQEAEDYFNRLNAQKTAEIEKGGREEAIESKIGAKQPGIKSSLGSLAENLPEETFDRSSMRQQYNVANGMTPTQAANEEKKNMMSLARAQNALMNNIGTRPLMETVSPELIRSIRNLKQPFKNNGELSLFKNTLVNNLDIGDHLASYETWNPGKSIEKEIINTSVNDNPTEIAARLGKHINENESLFSIGYLLNKIGVDDKAVIDEIMNLSENGLIKLDNRQMQEGAEYSPVVPKLEDDFFTAFGGLLLGPALKYISGQREKVGTMEKLKRNYGGKR